MENLGKKILIGMGIAASVVMLTACNTVKGTTDTAQPAATNTVESQPVEHKMHKKHKKHHHKKAVEKKTTSASTDQQNTTTTTTTDTAATPATTTTTQDSNTTAPANTQ